MSARIVLFVPGVVTVLLVALKLTHAIGWSWWWVLSPLWIGAAVLLAGIVLVLAALAVMSEVER